jgi:hypothetical protein
MPAIKVTTAVTEMFLRRMLCRTTDVTENPFTALVLLTLMKLLTLTVTLIQLCRDTLNWCIELGPFMTLNL